MAVAIMPLRQKEADKFPGTGNHDAVETGELSGALVS